MKFLLTNEQPYDGKFNFYLKISRVLKVMPRGMATIGIVPLYFPNSPTVKMKILHTYKGDKIISMVNRLNVPFNSALPC